MPLNSSDSPCAHLVNFDMFGIPQRPPYWLIKAFNFHSRLFSASINPRGCYHTAGTDPLSTMWIFLGFCQKNLIQSNKNAQLVISSIHIYCSSARITKHKYQTAPSSVDRHFQQHLSFAKFR